MARDFRVYLTGPMFSSGSLTANVHEAVKIAARLRAAGFQVWIPHLYVLWDMIVPADAQYYLEIDKHWLEACDVLFRIPGKSDGATKEEGWAEEIRMPILRPPTMLDVGAYISQLIAMVDNGDIPRRST